MRLPGKHFRRAAGAIESNRTRSRPSPLPAVSVSARFGYRLLSAIALALGLAACGGGSGAPTLPDACAVVGASLEGRLPGAGFSSYRIVAGPSKGHVEITNRLTGEFIYTANSQLRGTAPLLEDRFQFQAHHADGSSNVATYRLVYRPRILPLGDSIVWGGPGGTPCPDHAGFRKPLYDALRATGYVVDFVGSLRSGQGAGLDDPDHEGHGGWSADELVTGKLNPGSCTGSGRLDLWLDQIDPDVVLLHAGTNDLRNGGDPVAEAQDIGDILDRINLWELDNWPVYVLVARIILNYETEALEADTKLFNDTVSSQVIEPAIAQRDEVLPVDQEAALADPKYYRGDLFHPNSAGYQRMADVWLQALTGVLPKCP